MLDLGCGTGYWCAWFHRLGARPVQRLPRRRAAPHGERMRLLRDTGFEVEALHELYAPEGDPDEVRYFMRRGWAQQWPCEEVWVARRR